MLVNRVLHRNGQAGVEVIRRMKSEPGLAATPVMLLSNHSDYQQQALAAGAEPGIRQGETWRAGVDRGSSTLLGAKSVI